MTRVGSQRHKEKKYSKICNNELPLVPVLGCFCYVCNIYE